MFIKSLTISREQKIIREIIFRKGLNLIIDETHLTNDDKTETGNSVGETTVLKLIDFCLGADPKGIYVDPESKKEEYKLVKDFLKEKKVLVTLILKEDLDNEDSQEIIIERNFLSRKEIIRRINGNNLTEVEFEIELSKLIFPNLQADRPSFRQIISHNIRYKDQSINNTLKTLDKYVSDVEYETLFLYLFGIEFLQGSLKQNILIKLKQEETFKSRLEKNQTKTAYESALSLIEGDIKDLNIQKSNLNLNENFEDDLDGLNNVKYQINKESSVLSNLKIRRDLILEAEKDLNANKSNVDDLQQLKSIYEQASKFTDLIQKNFDDLVHYHNKMIEEKIKFIKKELPTLEKNIANKNDTLKRLLKEEKTLTKAISKSDSFEILEKLIVDLTEKFRQKGEYETIIQQLNEVDEEIIALNKQLKAIDDTLFTVEFEQIVKTQLNKFNVFFSSISNELYKEKYALKYDIIVNKKGQKLYKFSAFNLNMASGKKQGEISCFDIAYILFADEESIPCLHFILNDKKELMHDNQLVKISELANKSNIQFVASILKDKLPGELNNEEYFIIKLSSKEKLFKIE